MKINDYNKYVCEIEQSLFLVSDGAVITANCFICWGFTKLKYVLGNKHKNTIGPVRHKWTILVKPIRISDWINFNQPYKLFNIFLYKYMYIYLLYNPKYIYRFTHNVLTLRCYFDNLPNSRLLYRIKLLLISPPNAPTCPKALRVPPSGYGRTVTDFWSWDTHEALLRCPEEVDGDIWI
jgi:hypothetical protein